MSDKMSPISFQQLLKRLLEEYKKSKSFMYVPVVRNSEENYKSAIGPAAGPHTQLAGNIIAAYAAGASHFELKTVQIMEGEALGIIKPCIFSQQEVYNTEWSTELTVNEALGEYIKAYILLKLLIKELKLGPVDGFDFIMSVGYDLSGIKSEKINTFIENMKHAGETQEWQKDIEYVLLHMDLFENVSEDYVRTLSPVISDTIALSTMHGCKGEEIEIIARYLIEKKNLNTTIKMNPTLLGKEAIRSTLDTMGYDYITFEDEIFQTDINFSGAVKIIQTIQPIAEQKGKRFGVKLTNTIPVKISRDELQGKTMYLSGPALYPIAIGVAAKLQAVFKGKLPISYSGGADINNIKEILNTGIYPVTVSSVLLKPGGYKNISKMNEKVDIGGKNTLESVDVEALNTLAEQSIFQKEYHKKPVKKLSRVSDYSAFCAKCYNCVDVCPNRANERITIGGKPYVIHHDGLCNACGNCGCFCIVGHQPYLEKWTLFETKEAFETSENDGLFADGKDIVCRIAGKLHDRLPQEIEALAQGLVLTANKK